MTHRTLRLALLGLTGGALAAFAQTIALQGGEQFALRALPQQLQLTLKPGESRSFILEEQLASGLLWTARPQNPAQQTAIAHQLHEVTGANLVPTPRAATATVTGNLLGTSVVDFLLLPPGQQNAAAAPAATIRCYVHVAQPVVLPQPIQPPVVVQPMQPAPPPRPPAPIEVQHERYYRLDELPRVIEAKVRRDGGEIEFYLECDSREGFEWRALDDDRVTVFLDNDTEQSVHLHGHKNRRRIRCTTVRIVGFNRDNVRVVLEYYRNRRGRAERPVKTVDCMIRVR